MEQLQAALNLPADLKKRGEVLQKLDKDLASKIRTRERQAGRSLEDLQVWCLHADMLPAAYMHHAALFVSAVCTAPFTSTGAGRSCACW